MKALAILSLILVAGILGSTVAQRSDGERSEELVKIEKLQTFLNQLVDFAFLEDIGEPMRSSYRSKCRMNGGPNADNDFIKSSEIFINSLAALRDETQLQLETAADDPRGRLNATIETTCHSATATSSLTRTFTDFLKRCLTPAERNSIDLINNVSNGVVQYICKNDGRRISEFFAADGEKCFTSSGSRLENCASSSFSNNTSIIEKNDSQRSPELSVPIINLNTQVCRAFEEYQRCLVAVLQKCEHPIFSYETNSLLNIVKKSSGCEDLLKI